MTRRPSTRTLVLVGVAVSLVVAGVLSAWASTHPDGLEHVAQSLGFADTATSSATSGSPLAGYAAPGVGPARLSSGVAGVVGVVVVGLVMLGLLAWLRRPSSAEQER
ncbi:MAG TPA: PDGLE domain-containing protein [Ornithinibacter sp.]|nr:PDGLE domain-containing protein [Ornithinibacter sp.]